VPAEIEQGASWIDWLWKAIASLVIPLIGWIWRTNSETIEVRAAAKARMDAFETEITAVRGDVGEIKKGVGRILNHLTGTSLHDE